MQDLNSLLADESFQHWLSQKASRKEKDKWDKWLRASADHGLLYQEALKIWKSSQFRQAKPPKLDREWEKLSVRLNLKRNVIPEIATQVYSRRSRRDAWARFGAIAVAFAIVIAIMYRVDFFKNQEETRLHEFQTMSTEFGQRATIHLPEGTTIVLNANSSLRYPADWTGNRLREIELRGEAYFDVSPQMRKDRADFLVRTNDGLVKVVGTRFVVYERGQGTRVVVESGKVRVAPGAAETPDRSSVPEVLLNSGHLLHFQKGSQPAEPRVVNIEPYVTWWQAEMIFENTPFREIVQRLEETYGVEVRVSDARLLEKTLSGSIENQNLIIVTDALAKALRISVRRRGHLITFGK